MTTDLHLIVWGFHGKIIALLAIVYFSWLLGYFLWNWVDDSIKYHTPPTILRNGFLRLSTWPEATGLAVVLFLLVAAISVLWPIVYPVLGVVGCAWVLRGFRRLSKRIAPLVKFAHKHSNKASYERLHDEHSEEEDLT